MSPDVIRAVEAIVFSVFGVISLTALIRFVFYLAKLVSLQETMTKNAADFAVTFEKYCTKVESILDRHDGAIQRIETELELRARLEQYYARAVPASGRRAYDIPNAPMGDEHSR